MVLQCLVSTWHQKLSKNFSKNLFCGKRLHWRPEDVSRTSHWRPYFATFFGCPLDVFSKLKEYVIDNFSVSRTNIWWTTTENTTTEMSFVLMFKIVVMGTFGERFPPDVTWTYRTSPLKDTFRTFIQKPKIIKQLTLSGTQLVKKNWK